MREVRVSAGADVLSATRDADAAIVPELDRRVGGEARGEPGATGHSPAKCESIALHRAHFRRPRGPTELLPAQFIALEHMARGERNAESLVNFRLIENAQLYRVYLELIGQLIHRRLGRIESGHCAGSAHRRGRADIAPGASKRHAQVRHAVKEGRGLATVLVIIIGDCLVEDVIVLERDELAVRGRAQPHALLRSGTMPNRLEHHFAAHDDFDGLSELSRRRDGERAMGPGPQLAAEARTEEFRDHADVFLWQAEHLREHISRVEN